MLEGWHEIKLTGMSVLISASLGQRICILLLYDAHSTPVVYFRANS